MNKALPIIAIIFIASYTQVEAQKAKTSKKVAQVQANEKMHDIKEAERKETESPDLKVHDDGVTYIIASGRKSNEFETLATKIEVLPNGAFKEPMVLVPHLNSEMSLKTWNGLVLLHQNQNIPIRNVVITEPNNSANAIALAINSPQGVEFLKSSKMFSGPFSVILGYENLYKAKEAHVHKANQKYSLSKIIINQNVNFLPGEYGPVEMSTILDN